MKVDGRTKSGKYINATKKEIGLIGKIIKPFWLLMYLPGKYMFLGTKFLIKYLVVGAKFLLTNLAFVIQYLWLKSRTWLKSHNKD